MALGIAGLLVSGAVSALAQTPPPAPECPPAPNVYEGSDVVVDELRKLRAEQVETCLVVVDRVGQSRARTGDVVDALNGTLGVELAEGPGTAADTRLFVAGPPAPTGADGDELHVTVANPAEQTDVAPVVGMVEQSAEAQRSAVWFVAGLLAVLIAAPLVSREIRA